MYVKEFVLDSRQLDTKENTGMKRDKNYAQFVHHFLIIQVLDVHVAW